MTQPIEHPERPLKPSGVVYQRYIPWLDRTLIFRAASIEKDLLTFNRWMNDPVVSEFWQEAGDLNKHLTYLTKIAADPHVTSLIGCFDHQPFGYFEIYWAKEDRIAPFCNPDNFDRGWHVLIGEQKFRGKPFLTAWLPSISHYLFIDEPRTQRLVIEPRVDNQKMISNLTRNGYKAIKEFDFPHKRALLATLQRDQFFSEQAWAKQEHTSPATYSLQP